MDASHNFPHTRDKIRYWHSQNRQDKTSVLKFTDTNLGSCPLELMKLYFTDNIEENTFPHKTY
jgi:hypothetical protein